MPIYIGGSVYIISTRPYTRPTMNLFPKIESLVQYWKQFHYFHFGAGSHSVQYTPFNIDHAVDRPSNSSSATAAIRSDVIRLGATDMVFHDKIMIRKSVRPRESTVHERVNV